MTARGFFIAALLWLVPTLAAAQSATLTRYSPSPTPEDDFHLSRPTDLGHLRFAAQLHLDYGVNPLVWENTTGDGRTERLSIVEHQLVGTVGLALGLFDRLVIFAGLPVGLLMTGADQTSVALLRSRPADDTGLGDVYLGARVRLFGEEDDAFALGLQATVGFPTSGGGAYRGEQAVSFRPELTGEIRLGGGARIVLGAGALIREEVFYPDTNLFFSHELRLGAGLSVPVWTDTGAPGTHFDLLVQFQSGTAFRDFFGRASTTSEALGGVRFAHSSGVTLGLVAGPGITRGFGSPDLRGVFMLGWAMPREVAPVPVDPCADTPEDADGFEDEDGCLDPDNDADGILDVADACPNEPENPNDWEDTDGCPDAIPDTDGDGLLDPADACPTEPEDADGFEDENGCPDPDNDQDGVVDTADRCRDLPGVVENRGCPDQDRDIDTVVDRRDNCPDVPGPVENQGCPQRQSVIIAESGLEILDTVYFRTDSDVILRRSFALLDNVAAVLTAHPEIARIRVEGHTDSRGSREHNLDLSNRRAASVVRYLVDRGHIDAARLESMGYGPDRPVVEGADTPEEHAQNRRVVFAIVGEAEAISTTSSGPAADTIDR